MRIQVTPLDDMVVPEERPEEEDDDVDEHIEVDELEGIPFTYSYLSAGDSPQALNAEEEEDDDVILMEEASPPVNPAKDLDEDEGRKQATTHISVSPDVVLASTGEEREKWLAAGRKEIDNLTQPDFPPTPQFYGKAGGGVGHRLAGLQKRLYLAQLWVKIGAKKRIEHGHGIGLPPQLAENAQMRDNPAPRHLHIAVQTLL